MRQIELALKNEHRISVYRWRKPGETGQGNYLAQQDKDIANSVFGCVILEEDLLNITAKNPLCAQAEEASAMLNRLKDAKMGGLPFRVWTVLLQNEKGFPSSIEATQGLDPDHRWLVAEGGALKIRESVVEMDNAFARDLADQIAGWLEDNRAAILRKKIDGSDTPENSGKTAPAIADVERDYLRRSMPTWVRAVVPEAGEQGSPLDFHIDAFIALNGRLLTEADERPLTDWLFDPASPPVVLCGGPGVGKRCSLLAAAASFGALIEPGLQSYFSAAPAQSMLEKLKNRKDRRAYMPVLLQAEAIVRQACGGILSRDHVIAAVASELFGATDPDSSQVSAVARRMAEASYAVLIDGLESAGASRGVSDFADLFRDLDVEFGVVSGRTKIVAASRTPVLRDGMAVVELRPLTDEQINTFLVDFVNDRYKAPSERANKLEKLRQERNKLLEESEDEQTQEAAAEILRTPLLLSALCWATFASVSGFAKARIELSRALLSQIIPAQVRAGSNIVLDAGQTRALLQALACAGLDDERASLSLAQARQSAAGWLRSNPRLREEDAFFNLLVAISRQTSLIVEGGEQQFRFGTTFWAEHLAAEALAADRDHLEALLKSLEPASLSRYTTVFSTAAALIVSEGEEGSADAALRVPALALERAMAGDGDTMRRTPSHLACIAADVLAGIAPRCVDQSTAASARIETIIDRAVALFRDPSHTWTLRQRDALLNNLVRALRGGDAWAHARRAHDLFRKLLGSTGWARTPTQGASVRETAFAAWPVTFAEYDAFLRSLSSSDAAREYFNHTTGGDEAIRLDEAARLISTSRHKGYAAIYASMLVRPAAPVVAVTWYEAVAYCRWLTRRLRSLPSADGGIGADEIIRLPTLEECTSMRLFLAGAPDNYPWGDQTPPMAGDEARVNCLSAGFGRATAPGVFPSSGEGASEIWDFGSNVKIWTTPRIVDGEDWWPTGMSNDSDAAAFGAAWATEDVYLKANAIDRFQPLSDRRSVTGMRTVRARAL